MSPRCPFYRCMDAGWTIDNLMNVDMVLTKKMPQRQHIIRRWRGRHYRAWRWLSHTAVMTERYFLQVKQILYSCRSAQRLYEIWGRRDATFRPWTADARQFVGVAQYGLRLVAVFREWTFLIVHRFVVPFLRRRCGGSCGTYGESHEEQQSFQIIFYSLPVHVCKFMKNIPIICCRNFK